MFATGLMETLLKELDLCRTCPSYASEWLKTIAAVGVLAQFESLLCSGASRGQESLRKCQWLYLLELYLCFIPPFPFIWILVCDHCVTHFTGECL